MIFLYRLFTKKAQLLFIYIFLAAISCCAQTDSMEVVRQFAKKNYIQPYLGTFKRSFQFLSNEEYSKMHDLQFSPNSSSFAGVSLNYRKLSIYLETAIPNTHKVDRRKSDVRSSAIFVHHFEKKWGITGFASWNKGLLMYMPADGMYGDRNDLKMFTVGAHLYKIFNGANFSYSAANSMTRLQTKSKGSFMLMVTPVFRKLHSIESIIPDSLRPFHLNGTISPSRNLQFFSLQCKPGYAYNFVFNEGRYFIAPAIYAGLGAEYHYFKAGEELYGGLNLTTGYRMKLVTGINCEKFYCTLEYLRDKNINYLYKTNITNTYTELSCNLGVRF
jgi:Domain of unknown function (DUF4421)